MDTKSGIISVQATSPVHNIHNDHREPEHKHGCQSPLLAYSCPECTECFPTERNMLLHQRALHVDRSIARLKNRTEKQRKVENQLPDTIPSIIAVSTEASNVIVTEEARIASIQLANLQKVQSGQSKSTSSITNPFKCYMCADNPEFELKISLDQHLSTIHQNFEASNVIVTEEARIASIQLANLQKVQSGQSKSTSSITNPFKCYMCADNPEFELKISLDQHLSTIHQNFEARNCGKCNITYHTTARFNNHLARHNANETPHECSACPMRFAEKSQRSRHEASVHMIDNDNSEWSGKKCCLICGQKFANGRNMRVHMKTIHQKNALKNSSWCYLCSPVSQFNDNDSLAEHLAATHPKQESYSCTECNLMFHERAPFNWHLSMHDATIRPYKCSVCPKRFAFRSSKYKHEFYHGRNGDNSKYNCSSCKQQYNDEDELSHHMRTEHQSLDQTCWENSQNELLDHIGDAIKTEAVDIYDELPPEESPSDDSVEQNTKFEYQASSTAHWSTNHRTICEVKFTNQSSASVHIREPHRSRYVKRATNSNLFKCYLCSTSITFDNRTSLNSHLLDVHAKQEPYNCDECNKTVKTTISINKHHAQHDPIVRPHKCTICPLRFVAQDDRKHHEVNVHNFGNRYKTPLPSEKHSCAACGKQFAYKCRLDKHACFMKRPTKPVFRCYLCNGLIISRVRNTLVQHLAAMHPAQDQYTCQHCDFSSAELYEFNEHLSQHMVETTSPNMSEIGKNKQKTVQSAIANKNSNVASKQFPCETCGKKFKFECSQIRHERYMHSKRTSTIKYKKHSLKCYLCNTHIGSKQSLKEHLETAHPSQALYQCKKCTFSTNEKRNYNNHQIRHDRSIRQYKCRFCSLRYFTAQHRKCHEQFKHANRFIQENYACTECGGKFSSKCLAKLHVKNTSHTVHKTVMKIKTEPQEDEQLNDEQPHNNEWIHQHPIKTEEVHIYPDIPVEEHEAFYLTTVSYPVKSEPLTTERYNEQSKSDAIINHPNARDTAKTYLCHLCNPSNRLESRDMLVKHLASHTAQDMYHCGECGFSVSLIMMFNQHLAQHNVKSHF